MSNIRTEIMIMKALRAAATSSPGYMWPLGLSLATSAFSRRSCVSAGFCVCCGTEDVDVLHPLFTGSLCLRCKVSEGVFILSGRKPT